VYLHLMQFSVTTKGMAIPSATGAHSLAIRASPAKKPGERRAF
jgi:hypothetical protein